MNFIEAVKLMKKGKKVAQKKWYNGGHCDDVFMIKNHVIVFADTGVRAQLCDLDYLATDYMEVA